MSQNRNCKHSSKIWLQCIKSFTSTYVFWTCKNLLWTLWTLMTYQSNSLWYWAWTHITIPNTDHSNWARHRSNTSNKRKQKTKNPHSHIHKNGKENNTTPPTHTHRSLVLYWGIKLSDCTKTDNIGESHTNLLQSYTGESHRKHQNQDQNPHIKYY